jgi:hypothetical protein
MKTHKLLIVGAAFVLMLSCDTNSVSFSEDNHRITLQSTSNDVLERTSGDVLLVMPPKDRANKEVDRKPYS